ncbi:lethal (3) malignant brain tumor isoform X1 [Lycorma delicatula]|uniref:lethal (3) malignant brain tumor isoform X1 n=1 Tax=Lycorma delicatula TaxID=130591 RepID=UPI003F516C37
MNQISESMIPNLTSTPTASSCTTKPISGIVKIPLPSGSTVIASPISASASSNINSNNNSVLNANCSTVTSNYDNISNSTNNSNNSVPTICSTVTNVTPVTVSMTVSNLGSAIGTTVVTTAHSSSTSSSTITVATQSGSTTQTPPSTVTRMVPLIYLQPPVSVKTPNNSANSNNNNSSSNNNNSNNNTSNIPTTVSTTSITTSGAVQFTMSQIIAGNPQLIHTNNSSQQNQTFAYLGTLIKQSLKGKEATSQKVLLTPMAVQNKASQMTGVILPTSNDNHGGHSNKQAMASLILQPGPGTNVPGKMGLILPGSTATNPATGKTSLLLPAPPNATNPKKASLANIIVPSPVKTSNVPNIIRQSSSSTTNSGSKNPVTGYLLPSGSNSAAGLIIPTPAGVTKTSGNQVTGLIIPTSTPSTGIILPSTTSNSSGQLANLIFTTTPTSLPQTTNTPVAGLIMTGGNNAPNLLVSPSVVNSSTTTTVNITTGSITSTTATSNTKTMTGVFLPVSMQGQNKNTLTHHLTISNGKIHATPGDPSISVPGLKPVGSFSTLPPLQPITNKDGINKVIGVTPTSKPNFLNLTQDNNLTVTPVIEQQDQQSVMQLKEEKKDNEMEVEVKLETTDGLITDIKKENVDKDNNRERDKDNYINKEKEHDIKDSNDECVVLDGEVTMRRLNGSSAGAAGSPSNGADKENTSPDKPLDDEVKIEVIKQERDNVITPPVDDFDAMKVLEWDNKGVGKLPGSELKFRMNEFGMMILHDESDMKQDPESVTSTNIERKEEKRPHKAPIKAKHSRQPGGDEIFCCEGCGCYGLFTEFLDSKFCSIACKKSVLTKIAFNKKKEDDKLRELKLRRKKRKMKILQNKARKEMEMRAAQKDKETPVDWMKELAELRAKKAAQLENCDDSSKKDVFESPNMSEVDISIRSGTTSPTLTDDDHSDKRVLWVSKSSEFLWTIYLNHCKAKPAPIKLFKDPFPYGKNGFRVGMKLEGIDPEHQSYICVLSVAEVRGYRIRLHFDGYPENHDFWLNADSPDIFQPGWCEKNNHHLHRPRGYTMENFNWNLYLKQCKAQPAPRHLFSNRNASPICPNQFRVGMKLEAVDRKNSSLVCVATVTDIIDSRLLIHFDSWGDVYDYWADPTSPYIHPVGWCKENGHELTPPNTYKNPSSFSWDSYLKETKSVAAPARAFKTRPPSGFRQGMKLEAVDKRAPHLIRVATVRDIHQHQIKITFDGFPDHFGYWVDDDSPDIHPVGWTQKTGHPLEPPPVGDEKTECTTPGCKGDGHIKGAKFTVHKHPSVCPYSSQNMNRDSSSTPDRFCTKPELYEVPEASTCKPRQTSNSIISPNEDNNNSSSSLELRSMKTRLSCYGTVNPTTTPIMTPVPTEDEKEKREERRGRKRKVIEPEEPSEELNRLRRDLIETVLKPGYQVNPDPPPCWTKHSTTFGLKIDWFQGDPRRWSYKQVSAFINTIHPMRNRVFIDQEIDGEALLMLTQSDLTDLLGLKLGPAIKIFNIISLLRQKVL